MNSCQSEDCARTGMEQRMKEEKKSIVCYILRGRVNFKAVIFENAIHSVEASVQPMRFDISYSV